MSESLHVPAHLANPQFRKTLDAKVEERGRRAHEPDSWRPGRRPLRDRWFNLDLNERERLIRENSAEIALLENLPYSGDSAAADKLLAANI